MSIVDDMSNAEKIAAYGFFHVGSPFQGIEEYQKSGLDTIEHLVPGAKRETRLKQFLDIYRRNVGRLQDLQYDGIPDEVLYRYCCFKVYHFSGTHSRSEMLEEMRIHTLSTRNALKEFLINNIKEIEEKLGNGNSLDYDSLGLGNVIETLKDRWNKSADGISRKNYQAKKDLLERFAKIKKNDEEIYRNIILQEPAILKEWRSIFNGGIVSDSPEEKCRELWDNICAEYLAWNQSSGALNNFFKQTTPITLFRNHVLILKLTYYTNPYDFIAYLSEFINR